MTPHYCRRGGMRSAASRCASRTCAPVLRAQTKPSYFTQPWSYPGSMSFKSEVVEGLLSLRRFGSARNLISAGIDGVSCPGYKPLLVDAWPKSSQAQTALCDHISPAREGEGQTGFPSAPAIQLSRGR